MKDALSSSNTKICHFYCCGGIFLWSYYFHLAERHLEDAFVGNMSFSSRPLTYKNFEDKRLRACRLENSSDLLHELKML